MKSKIFMGNLNKKKFSISKFNYLLYNILAIVLVLYVIFDIYVLGVSRGELLILSVIFLCLAELIKE